MSRQQQARRIRTRKLGVLLYDARIATRKSNDECAQILGITPQEYQRYEQGEVAPSLPELEILACYLDVPLEHFWDNIAISEIARAKAELNSQTILPNRQRAISTQLHQYRLKKNTPPEELAEQTGIPEQDIEAYELGEKPIPFPELEGIIQTMGLDVEAFLEHRGPLASWRRRRESSQQVSELPPEIQAFVSNPVNLPYLEIALRLSGLSVERLRAVAESILEITL